MYSEAEYFTNVIDVLYKIYQIYVITNSRQFIILCIQSLHKRTSGKTRK